MKGKVAKGAALIAKVIFGIFLIIAILLFILFMAGINAASAGP